jgi:hypothetical protein
VGRHHAAGSEDAFGYARRALRVDLARFCDVQAPELARLPDQAHGTVELYGGLAEGDDVPVDGTQIPAATGRDTLQRDAARGSVVVAHRVAPSDVGMVVSLQRARHRQIRCSPRCRLRPGTGSQVDWFTNC